MARAASGALVRHEALVCGSHACSTIDGLADERAELPARRADKRDELGRLERRLLENLANSSAVRTLQSIQMLCQPFFESGIAARPSTGTVAGQSRGVLGPEQPLMPSSVLYVISHSFHAAHHSSMTGHRACERPSTGAAPAGTPCTNDGTVSSPSLRPGDRAPRWSSGASSHDRYSR